MMKPHILLVDDEPSIREFLSLIFQEKGIAVTEAENGWEALTLFQAHPTQFDLLITDDQMPKMNGRALIATLKKMNPNLPVILCSAGSLKEIREADVECHSKEDYFFKKPYSIEKLEQIAFCLLKKCNPLFRLNG